MTPENDAPEWYLEGPGETRNGPYSIRQLQAFRREAKISDRSRVTSTYLGNQWRTIVEILGPSGEVTKNFSPPPRPEIERTSTALLYTTKQRSNINSAVSLLDTLHAARERKPKLEVMGAPEPEQNSSGIRKVVLLPLVLISVSALAWVLLSSEDSATKTKPAAPKSVTRIQDSKEPVKIENVKLSPPAPSRISPPGTSNAAPPLPQTAPLSNSAASNSPFSNFQKNKLYERPQGGAVRSTVDRPAPPPARERDYNAPPQYDDYNADDRGDEANPPAPKPKRQPPPLIDGSGLNEPMADPLDENLNPDDQQQQQQHQQPHQQRNPPPLQFE